MKTRLIACCLAAAGIMSIHQVAGASNTETVAASPMFRSSLENAITRMDGVPRGPTRTNVVKGGAAKACAIALQETSAQESCFDCTYASGPTACDYTSCAESCQPTSVSTCWNCGTFQGPTCAGSVTCDYTSCAERCQTTSSSGTCTGATCQFTSCESATCYHTCSETCGTNPTCTGPPNCP